MQFVFKAKDERGTTIKGVIEALNEGQALEILRKRNLVILDLKEAIGGEKGKIKISFTKEKVSSKDMVIFSRQLAVIISAGLPLVQALETLVGQTGNKYLDKIIGKIADEVRGGTRFSSSLERYPKIFDKFYVYMVRAGEVSGKLDEVLSYLADEKEKSYDLERRIKGAMIYPVFVLVTVVVIMILLLTFVIPQITSLITEGGGEIPLPTKIVISLSDFLRHKWYIILGLVGVLFIFYFFLANSSKGKPIWDRLVLKIPVFGPLFQKVSLVRFTNSLSTLIVGGIPLPQALKITADIVGNVCYQKIILETIRNVESGSSIATAFLSSPLIPKILSHSLIVGEQTGKLDEVLSKMSSFYSQEVENTLSQLVSLLEPIIIVVLGVVVGGIVLSVFMPIYQLASIQF
ncbi:MAG: Type II secretion system protein F [Parcubacteria group bacterium ADurb.Bin159]|nr:MAG: Type II secretion system protein F [Parcubacteria group bacterium ADurb.Bin159]